MTPVLIRIALRYAAAVLVARGLMGSEDASAISSDPDIQMAIEAGIGLAIAGATEAWHWAAQKFNWSH